MGVSCCRLEVKGRREACAGYQSRRFDRSDYVHLYWGYKQRCPGDLNARAANHTGWLSHPMCSPHYNPTPSVFCRPPRGLFPHVWLKLPSATPWRSPPCRRLQEATRA